MNNQKKIIVSILFLVVLVGGFHFSSALYYNKEVIYSNPEQNTNYEIDKKVVNYKDNRIEISKDKWNQIFEDYRNGKISKEEASKLIKEVKIYNG